MLQATNINDPKPEWSINETHILIPLIDGGFVSSKDTGKTDDTNALNILENNETSGFEQNLVIGLDGNFFESSNKNDLLVLQNSELKLLTCNADSKTSVTYTLSYADPNKNETLWESLLTKDKTKSEWCSGIEFSFSDNSKAWQDKIEKSNESINLEEINNEIIPKINNNGIPIVTRETLNKANASVFSSSCEVTQTKINDYKGELIKTDNNTSDFFNLKITNKSIGQKLLDELNCVQKNENSLKICLNQVVQNINLNDNKELSLKDKSCLPEKSLPLKKKAKMKRTMLTSNCSVKTHKVEEQSFEENLNGSKLKQNRNIENSLLCDSDEICKKRKIVKANIDFTNIVNEKNLKEKSNKKIAKEEKGFVKFEDREFSDIYELVNELKNEKIINSSAWQLLQTGLKEMNVDILKEMKSKKESFDSIYSPQLKAFALVLRFKQPAAFNCLSKIYKNGWPSFNVIKEWKRKLNEHRKQNFNKKAEGNNFKT